MTAADAGATPPPPPRQRRWLLPLLVVSLAANLLVAGIVVANQFRPQPRPQERMSPPSFSQILPRSFITEMPQARRQELRQVFEAHKASFRDDKRALRDSALAVADSLAREPFDAALAKAAIDEYGTRSRALVDLGMTVASEVVDRLGPEERKVLASRIRDRSTPARSRKRN